jgi:hypothetical protein
MKTTTRSAIIFVSLFAIATAHSAKSEEPMKYSVLAIEYVGELDKPITPIVISDSRAGARWYRDAVLKRGNSELTYIHVVPVSLLEKLIAETDLHKGIPQSEQAKGPKSSEAVSATIVTPQRRTTFLYDRESAISLLDGLQKRCKHQEALRSDLAHFQDRIRP